MTNKITHYILVKGNLGMAPGDKVPSSIRHKVASYTTVTYKTSQEVKDILESGNFVETKIALENNKLKHQEDLSGGDYVNLVDNLI